MSSSIKTIYPCNHIVTEYTACYDDIVLSNIQDSQYLIPANIEIHRIDRIYDSNQDYYENHDYIMGSNNNIFWISKYPMPEALTITSFYIKIETNNYAPEQCVRCSGNGWYVDILDSTKTEVKIVSGITKLVQEVIKTLYSPDTTSSFGTLDDIIGTTIYNEQDVYIKTSSIIDNCYSRIQSNQLKALQQGIVLSDDEILTSLSIANMQFIRKEATYYISISISSKAGKNASFNFKI